MNNKFRTAVSRSLAAIGGVLLATVICLFLIEVVQHCIDHVQKTVYLAHRAQTYYMKIAPMP